MENHRDEPGKKDRNRNIFKILAFFIVWALCELILALGAPRKEDPINTLDPEALIQPHRKKLERLIRGETEFIAFSRELGWTHKPWGHHGLDAVNGQGIRALRDYSPAGKAGFLRIETFGGSFMYGAEVPGELTWQALMEVSHPRLEVLNFGVSGYGTDQALLRFRLEGKGFSPDIVIMGFINEHCRRNQSAFRPFYIPHTGLPLGKPRFCVEKQGLRLIPNPFQSLEDYRNLLADPAREIPRIGASDGYYSQYKTTTTAMWEHFPSVLAFRHWWPRLVHGLGLRKFSRETESQWAERVGRTSLLFQLFDTFSGEVRESGAQPLFMLCPIDFEYREVQSDRPNPYPVIRRYLLAQGEKFLDLVDVFAPYLENGGKVNDLFVHGKKGGHYSALAHRLIAAALWNSLQGKGFETALQIRCTVEQGDTPP